MRRARLPEQRPGCPVPRRSAWRPNLGQPAGAGRRGNRDSRAWSKRSRAPEAPW